MPSAAGIRTRFALLLVPLLAGFFATWFFIRQNEHAEAARLLADARQQQTTVLDHWLGATERSLRDFTTDLARHGPFARLPALPDPAAVTAAVSRVLANSDAHNLWVVTDDGTLLLSVGRPEGPLQAPLPIATNNLRGLLDGARPPHVFAEQDGTLLELCGEPIPAPDTNKPPLGWVLVGRRWGPAHLATLSSLTEADVRLVPAGAVSSAESGGASVGIVRSLADWQGRPLRQLVVRRETPELALLLGSDAWHARVFLVFGLLVVVGLVMALNTWVLRPLAAIRESLARGEAAPVAPLRADRTELGAIAELVVTSLAQRDKLRQEVVERTNAELALRHSEEKLRRSIDERASLGRDLHDGVIQSLYAAGMSLAGVRALLKSDQEEAAVRLEQSRAALNETIRDVRNFIDGLEPETPQSRSFSQAVASLLGSMQSLRTFIATPDIDDLAAARLTLGQRAHSLQIAREAVSNALRHGKASAIAVTLRITPAGIEFEIRDNGSGFVPGSTPRTPGSGHGLVNFNQRARDLGAELVLSSEIGVGTTVRLIFPSSP